jgi:DNA (cytosine-5)-methyltransferase 1
MADFPKPEKTLRLGDPAWLAMDMTEASGFWGVEVPISGRNRRNGSKKRKQEEIEALRIQGMDTRKHG